MKRWYRAHYGFQMGYAWLDFEARSIDEATDIAKSLIAIHNMQDLVFVETLPWDYDRKYPRKEPAQYSSEQDATKPKKGLLSRLFPIVSSICCKRKNMRNGQLCFSCVSFVLSSFWLRNRVWCFQNKRNLVTYFGITNHSLVFQVMNKLKFNLCLFVVRPPEARCQISWLVRIWRNFIEVLSRMSRQLFHSKDLITAFGHSGEVR